MVPTFQPPFLRRALALLTAALILKVTAEVVLGYQFYFPPNFASEFLRGRRDEFFGDYQWAFYAHIASGPVSLILGLTLLSKSFRSRHPHWHRRLGRVQAACVLLLVAPSGLWMAPFTRSGSIAAAGFAALAISTAACVALGWRAAVRRRFAAHERWMSRGFVLLCSAVVLRLMGGLATVTGIEAAWFDPVAAWACWIVPLAVYECGSAHGRRAISTGASRPPMQRSGQVAET